jgi:hypothetical protein
VLELQLNNVAAIAAMNNNFFIRGIIFKRLKKYNNK